MPFPNRTIRAHLCYLRTSASPYTHLSERQAPSFRSPGRVEALKGVKPGDWVISKGAETLEDGTSINITCDQLGLLTAPRKLQ